MASSNCRWFLPACALLVVGCQSFSSLSQLDEEQTYTAEEIASIEELQPREAPETNHIQPVSFTQTALESSQGQVEQFISQGQAAIQQAGPGDQWKLQQAQQAFQQALGLDPRNSSAHHGLAIVADLQENWMAAEQHYKQALQQKPNDADLLNDLGYSYLLQNKFYESSQYLNQAISIYPQHERAHINLALLALKRENTTQAQSILARIYSGGEIASTLAQLQQEVQATPAPTLQPVQPVQPAQELQTQRPPSHQPVVRNPDQSGRPVHIFPSRQMQEQVNSVSTMNTASHEPIMPNNGMLAARQSVSTVGQGVPVGNMLPGPLATTQSQMHSNAGQGIAPAMQPTQSAAHVRNVYPPAGLQGQPGLPTQFPTSLAGLNAGPGLPFPIGVQYQPPGGTPTGLPAAQQQQQMIASAPRQFGPYPSLPANAANQMVSPAMTAQVPFRTVSSPASLHPVPSQGGAPAIVGPATSPQAAQALQQYQQQLQNLNSQYYQTLQQLNSSQPFPGSQRLQ